MPDKYEVRGSAKYVLNQNNKTKNTYGPCSTICPISFRLITFEIRQIAIKADHSRDHQGCANKYCFSSFSFSATLKSSRFQVVKGIIMAKSAVVHKTTNTSRNIVPSEEKKIRSPAYRRKESFGHLYFYICWIENLRDWNINDVPGSVFGLFLHCFSIKSEYQITCRTPTAVEIRCLNSPVIILPIKILRYQYLWLFGNKDAGNTRHFSFSRNTCAEQKPLWSHFWKLDRWCIPGETCT